MTKKVIIITGPTGVGKSELSLALAKDLQTQIISADSMQIYKGMDIGTAKVSKAIRSQIKHHMIDIISPESKFSVKEFQAQAFMLIDQLHSEGLIPIIVGGTGLYINSLLYKYDFSNVAPNPSFRKKMNDLLDKKPDIVLEKLNQIDASRYGHLTVRDRKKIIRALEVYEFSGQKITVDSQRNEDYNFFTYVINQDRKVLYDKINKRVDKMLSYGLVNEVKGLLSDGLTEADQSMKAIGYKEIIPFIQGKIDYDAMVEQLKQDTRRYAKRQLTWFRRIDFASWLNKDDLSQEDMINKIKGDINEF